jgi:hypothetical protein
VDWLQGIRDLDTFAGAAAAVCIQFQVEAKGCPVGMVSDEQPSSNWPPMGVPVVDVRIMWMRVDQLLVAMPVGMLFAGWVVRTAHDLVVV